MTKNAINGSVINKTAFPGSEDGLSLVELVGTVEVTASVSAVKLRLLASATTGCNATGTAQTTSKAQLSAIVSGVSTTSAFVYSKTTFAAYGQLLCNAVSGVRLTYQQSVSESAAATASAYAYSAAKNSASASGLAVAADTNANTFVSRSAATDATATASAAALRKTAFGAELALTANGIARIAFISRIHATGTASVAWSASSRFNVLRGASVAPRSDAVVSPGIKLLTVLNRQQAAAECTSLYSVRQIKFDALSQANALSNARIRLKCIVSAFATAQATGQSTASDFASSMPAPAERLMTVQASDRRMGVSE